MHAFKGAPLDDVYVLSGSPIVSFEMVSPTELIRGRASRKQVFCINMGAYLRECHVNPLRIATRDTINQTTPSQRYKSTSTTGPLYDFLPRTKYQTTANSTMPPNVTELKFMDCALTSTEPGQKEKNHSTNR